MSEYWPIVMIALQLIFVAGVVKLFEKSDCVGHISHLAVAPEYQHKGIGHFKRALSVRCAHLTVI